MTKEPRLATRGLGSVAALSACLLMPGIVAPSGVMAATLNGRTIELVTGDWIRNAHKQGVRLSGDGLLVAFTADAAESPFAAAGSSGLQVYARNLGTAALEQISVDSNELGGIGLAFAGGISPDGRFVTFSDYQRPYTGRLDAYVRDRLLGVTEVVSIAAAGGISDGYTQLGDTDISADGRYMAYSSSATNLVPNDTNGAVDVFLRDRIAGTTTRLSVPQGGGETNGDSNHVRISDDGSTVVFESQSTDLMTDGGASGVFALDRATMTLERVSVSSAGAGADGPSGGCAADISGDGRIVTFTSEATNLVADDTNYARDVFVRDRTAGTTTRVSVNDLEAEGSFFQGFDAPSMSADGTKVAFVSDGPLNPGDPVNSLAVYLRDLTVGTTQLISIGADGSAADGYSGYCYNGPGLDIDDVGDVIAFHSTATNLLETADPVAGYFDVFVSRPAPADGDADGISDDIDSNPGVASTTFSDGTTAGQLSTVPVGFSVAVKDAVSPADGVHVVVSGAGSQEVVMSVCGLTVRLPAGADVVLTCGSLIVKVAEGSPPIDVVIGGGLAIVSIPAGGGAEVSAGPGGSFVVQHVSGGSVTVMVDGLTTTVEPGAELSGSAWDFQGFSSPIDNGGTMNVATAGRALPVRWRLVGADGRPVTNLSTATLTVASLSCALGATTDQVEEYAAGASGLLNLGNGNYQVNWKTPKTYAGSCKTLRLNIGDGVIHEAMVRFVR